MQQEDESVVSSRSAAVAATPSDLCAAVALEFDEDECEVEDFVPVEIPPPMDEIQTHTLPTQQQSVSGVCACYCAQLLTVYWWYILHSTKVKQKEMLH